MSYKIILHKDVVKFINARTSKEKSKIKEKFELLIQNPYPANFNIDTKYLLILKLDILKRKLLIV